MARRRAPASVAAVPVASQGMRPRLSMIWLGLALAFLPFVAAGATVDPFQAYKWPAIMAATVIFCLLAALEAKRQNGRINFPPVFPPAVFFIAVMVILSGIVLSALGSPAPGLAWRTTLREFTLVGLAAGIAVTMAQEQEKRWLLRALLIAMGCQAGIMLLQLFAPSTFFFSLYDIEPVAGRSAMMGTIGNPEFAAGWLAAGIPALCWLIFATQSGASLPFRKPTMAGLLVLSSIAIFLSGGRGALLAAVGAISFAVIAGWPHLVKRGKVSRRFWMMTAAVIAIAAGSVLLVPRELRGGTLLARIGQTFDLHSTSVQHRIGLMTITSRMIAERPLLGTGPGRYGAGFGETSARLARDEEGIGFWSFGDMMGGSYVSQAHCDPLQWWAEYGLLPAIGLALLLGAIVDETWRTIRRGKSTTDGAIALIAISLAINLWIAFPLHEPVRAFTFWVAVGVMFSRGGEKRDYSEAIGSST